MTTPQILAAVEHARKDDMIARLSLPDQKRDAAGALIVLLCAGGICAAMFLGWVLGAVAR